MAVCASYVPVGRSGRRRNLPLRHAEAVGLVYRIGCFLGTTPLVAYDGSTIPGEGTNSSSGSVISAIYSSRGGRMDQRIRLLQSYDKKKPGDVEVRAIASLLKKHGTDLRLTLDIMPIKAGARSLPGDNIQLLPSLEVDAKIITEQELSVITRLLETAIIGDASARSVRTMNRDGCGFPRGTGRGAEGAFYMGFNVADELKGLLESIHAATEARTRVAACKKLINLLRDASVVGTKSYLKDRLRGVNVSEMEAFERRDCNLGNSARQYFFENGHGGPAPTGEWSGVWWDIWVILWPAKRQLHIHTTIHPIAPILPCCAGDWFAVKASVLLKHLLPTEEDGLMDRTATEFTRQVAALCTEPLFGALLVRLDAPSGAGWNRDTIGIFCTPPLYIAFSPLTRKLRCIFMGTNKAHIKKLDRSLVCAHATHARHHPGKWVAARGVSGSSCILLMCFPQEDCATVIPSWSAVSSKAQQPHRPSVMLPAPALLSGAVSAVVGELPFRQLYQQDYVICDRDGSNVRIQRPYDAQWPDLLTPPAICPSGLSSNIRGRRSLASASPPSRRSRAVPTATIPLRRGRTSSAASPPPPRRATLSAGNVDGSSLSSLLLRLTAPISVVGVGAGPPQSRSLAPALGDTHSAVLVPLALALLGNPTAKSSLHSSMNSYEHGLYSDVMAAYSSDLIGRGENLLHVSWQQLDWEWGYYIDPQEQSRIFARHPDGGESDIPQSTYNRFMAWVHAVQYDDHPFHALHPAQHQQQPPFRARQRSRSRSSVVAVGNSSRRSSTLRTSTQQQQQPPFRARQRSRSRSSVVAVGNSSRRSSTLRSSTLQQQQPQQLQQQPPSRARQRSRSRSSVGAVGHSSSRSSMLYSSTQQQGQQQQQAPSQPTLRAVISGNSFTSITNSVIAANVRGVISSIASRTANGNVLSFTALTDLVVGRNR